MSPVPVPPAPADALYVVESLKLAPFMPSRVIGCLRVLTRLHGEVALWTGTKNCYFRYRRIGGDIRRRVIAAKLLEKPGVESSMCTHEDATSLPGRLLDQHGPKARG